MVGLQVSRNELVITTSFFGLFQLGRYTFVPSQVTAITRYGVIPFFGEGVQIQHTVAEYPRKIVFQYRTKSVLEGIASTGFTAQASPEAREAAAKISGSPYRWITVAALMVIWNLVFFSQSMIRSPHSRFPEPPIVAMTALYASLALGTLRFPWLQALLLKPGRSIGEVRPQMLLAGAVLSVMTVVFSLMLGVGSG
ncbi:MAG: hypothetical protein JWO89_2050 [Verrucomicrobiaceae bacterium]|nr:hypothetical protein [Verrucomicrobiaceae bacterium]